MEITYQEIQQIKQRSINDYLRITKPELVKNLSTNNFPVPQNKNKKLRSMTASTTCSQIDEEELSQLNQDNTDVVPFCNGQPLHQSQVNLVFSENKSNMNSLDKLVEQTASSSAHSYNYASGKEKLIWQNLSDFKRGMKNAFTPEEYDKFSKISKLLILKIQFSHESDFKKKSVASMIYSIMVLICGYLNIPKKSFWKAMSVEKSKKDNIRIDRIKGTACYLACKKVFKEMIKDTQKMSRVF